MQKVKWLFLALSFASLVACGKKSDDGTSVNGGRDARTSGGPANLPTGQGSILGQINTYVTGSDQTQFDNAVKTLASATVDPQSIGSTSPQNGVELRGRVTVDRNTGAAVNSSEILLTIHDSNENQMYNSEPLGPIQIHLSNATGSASNGSVNLSFSDDKGSITITGNWDSSSFRGQVKFANKVGSYNGQSSGTLGNFQIQTCAFFNCQ